MTDENWEIRDLVAPLEGWYATAGRRRILSFITSHDEGKGHVTSLLESWKKDFDWIAVPTPSVKMRGLCERRGFTAQWVDMDGDVGEAMIWERRR